MRKKTFKNFRKLHSRPYTIQFSQNFIKSQALAEHLVGLCKFKNTDTVIEIGPGKGIFTQFLVKKTKTVVAIEKDPKLAADLKMRYLDNKNITVVAKDFLEWNLPKDFKYKVIGNIPFSLSSSITRKLLESQNPPEEVFFIVQKEFVERLMGKEKGETLFSLGFKPWFITKSLNQINPKEFSPVPSVNPVFISIAKNNLPSISLGLKNSYLKFISYCFNFNNPVKHKVFEKIFTRKQQLIIKQRTGISLDKELGEIVFSEWVNLFNTFMLYSNNEIKNEVIGK